MKKVILILGMSFIVFGQSIAMSSSSDKSETKVNKKQCENHDKHHKNSKSGYVHKFVDIYANDNATAEKVGSIKFKERSDYSIFFCKENNWCEVVNQKDGNTGWVSLDELKKAQEKYAQVMQKKSRF